MARRLSPKAVGGGTVPKEAGVHRLLKIERRVPAVTVAT